MAQQVLFDIQKSDKCGRYATASKNLAEGETIFSEIPFAFGPKTDSPVVCLGCCTPTDGSILCSSCQWPVCGPECEQIPAHKQQECKIFSKEGVKFQSVSDPTDICPQIECITPLRVLLTLETNSERWNKEVEMMESHSEERKTKPVWEFNQINVVNFLRGPCKLDRFDEDLIHKVCGILDVNAFEARTQSGYSIRCLYPKLAILNHNCVSNITHSIESTGVGDENDFRVNVRANVAVKKGEELCSSYTYSLWPTIVRREFLKESKYFECCCKRCTDPTELETHMSSLKCNKCDNGLITSINPLDDSAIWKCSHCTFTTPSEAVRKVFAKIQSEIDEVEYLEGGQAIEHREQLCRKYKSVLHPRNAYNVILRVALSQLYGKIDGYSLEDLPDLLLERKMEMCKLVLQVADVIEPGCSRLRGLTLYELHVPLILLAKNQYAAGEIDKDGLRKKLNEAIEVLEKSVKILSLEPPGTTEGTLGQMANQNLTQLKENLEIMIETADQY
ncbi:SET domain-containing protein SmydA-8-like [Agrilus planipennis]|uniref:SET domain-containing protein SmydA-8-like n=1 Tax=Agrilus planipennis TaxID=224129 RepID=A0A1W4XBQ1_AGRPL|nr:SET domain-containing protein SmydA-8-like [Agrilus planipennis]